MCTSNRETRDKIRKIIYINAELIKTRKDV